MDDRILEFLNTTLSAEDQEVNDALAFVENLRRQEEARAEDHVSLADLAEKPVPRAKKRRRRPLDAFIPYRGDPLLEIARKLLLLTSLLVFIGALSMLLNEAVIIPQQNANLAQELNDIRYGNSDPELTTKAEAWSGYPVGIRDDLKTLYYLNNDIRGWLKYSACGVDREVMHTTNNDYYLTHDFYRNQNKNGTLFFDAANNLNAANSRNQSLVIYGHNMASGQMFAKLNNLASSLTNMKNANQIITLDTLFDTRQYKIFAVVLQDSNSKPEHYYSIQATSFTNSDQFLKYVDGLRARSLYDFADVDVKAGDELLILYTCTPKSIAHFDDARLAVVARRVRSGESATPAAKVTNNTDVIMPYRWYTAQKKAPHAYYGGGSSSTTTTQKTTTTTAKGTTAKGTTTTAATTRTTTTTAATTTTTKAPPSAGNP